MRAEVTRREFLEIAAGSAAVSAVRIKQAPRPNVLFILADDLGYGDVSCYGRPDYQTPAIDGLAQQGLKFTSAYAAAPVCTPTRCGFLTGRYPQRLDVGLQEPLTRKSPPHVGLPPGHPTIASLLKQNGYDTALIGKWHLGWKPEFGPNQHGYDEFFGILSGAADYFTHSSPDGAAKGTRSEDLWENLTPIERPGYLTDILTDRAIEYVRKKHDKPFYLSLHYTAPHAPWEGPEHAAIDHTRHGGGPMTNGGSLKIFASMMKSLDTGVGRVLEALGHSGLEKNTLVIFTSDNGGERYSFNWPFSADKGLLWEGGIRVPAMVRWPGVVPSGRTTDQVATTMDWTATILAVTGTQPDRAYPLDGDDLLPVCTGSRPAYDRTLFWRTVNHDAGRHGKWKYLKDAGEEHLFDLTVDPGEKTDLQTEHAGVFDEMRKRYAEWNAKMLPRRAD
jgi:arylsulfatase A-like enzyme